MNRFGRFAGLGLMATAALIVVSLPASAQDAAATYKAKCAACHGPDGKGDTSMGKVLKVRDLGSADVQNQSDADLTAVIENGKSKMPGYKGKLTDAQIKGLVSYIRSLKK